MSECFIKLQLGNSLLFSINTDGTYIRTALPIDAVEHDNGTISQESLCLLQCYSNGHINKVYVKELKQLRINFTYSHGIFPNSLLQFCDICTDDDFVIVLFEKLKIQYISIISVSILKSHTMLGLKGYNILKSTYDTILKWYILPSAQSVKVANLIAHCSRYGYISQESEDFTEELLWLNNNIIKYCNKILHPELMSPQTIDDGDDTFCDFSNLIGEDKQIDLRKKFSDYLKNGRTIPIGQSHVKDVLSLCKSQDDFWRVIKCWLQ